MSFLSSIPTDILIEDGNRIEIMKSKYVEVIDAELDSRCPDETTFYFGGNIFLPLKEYDHNGQVIISEVISYYDDDKEVWL